MNICLEANFTKVKRTFPDMDDKRALDSVYIGVSQAVAGVGTHEDLKELVKQYNDLLSTVTKEAI
ncbi:hypothetical protein [Bacillus sp. PK3_68]|uniref:hypothetical protein n=1 Tax=Bacillus sp. PK3_68 TaxID=2027408 RepID=UPI000E74FA66|nr:hypothetical protein [Bacillus sp. PK3_68]RJS60145.1 hypothetical protein CJ483_08775 [Bacillus sp. PK3_68]